MIDEHEFNRLMEEVIRKKQERLERLDAALMDYLTSENPNFSESARKYGLTKQQVRNHFVRHQKNLQKDSN